VSANTAKIALTNFISFPPKSLRIDLVLEERE
jgi:hypothetical protein